MKSNTCMSRKSILPFLVLIGVTIIALLPGRREIPSVFLTAEETENENQIRTDYVDENGQITFASNLRYATIIKTLKNGNVVLEEYFDEKGKPAVLGNGSSQVAYDYNENGQAEWIHYLDENGEPVVLKSGYSSIHRTYDEEGRAFIDTYYVGDNQVETTDKYYCFKRGGYDENDKPTELCYLNRDAEPTIHKNGYAFMKREYYDADGHVKRDFYFDLDGRPTASSAGQYGYYREYDEDWHETLTTYLDAKGNPMNISGGYAAVRTVYEKPSIKRLYFDKDGNPAEIGEGKYGTETVNGKTYYLRADGSRVPQRIDTFLYGNPFAVLVLGAGLTILSLFVKGKGRIVLIVISIGIILVMTVLFRTPGSVNGKILIFESFVQMVSDKSTFQSVLNNIWLFVPLGAAVYKRNSKRWLVPVGVTLAVETFQLITGMGTFEVADLICNSLGGFIGYGVMSYSTGRDQRENDLCEKH